MLVHIIVDYMYLYYKYKGMILRGAVRGLVGKLDGIGGEEEMDITNIYYPLKEIEGFRRKFEECGNDVVVSVCFDSPSPERKDKDGEYKSNRVSNRLDGIDFDYIAITRALLERAGHNVYIKDATEADDLIHNLVRLYKDRYDLTAIYTPDTDLLINIDDNVVVYRYKARKGYTVVGKRDYEEYCLKEYGVKVGYNGILLYKSLCGDKSDKVSGVKGYGPRAYMRFIEENKIEWDKLNDVKYIEDIYISVFSGERLGQALHSLDMVKPIEFDIDFPKLKSTRESRAEAYTAMKSLVK